MSYVILEGRAPLLFVLLSLRLLFRIVVQRHFLYVVTEDRVGVMHVVI
jgi:hypothetical protein